MVNIYEKALSFIKIRPHHSTELGKKLLMRGFGRDEVQDVIGRLLDEGLLNDAQFGQMYLESLIKYKTFGFYGLKVKLMSRGIASNDAENLLRENFSVDQEKEMAQRLVEKFKNLDRIKVAQRLSRKGFRAEVISQVLDL